MNFGLLKASIDVSNDRLEKAVAQALGHTVSGGVTGATHDVAEYLQANNGLSVKNPMNQQLLKNHLMTMKVDVDSLLNKTKVVFKGGVDRSGRGNGSSGFSVGPMPTDKDVSDMMTQIKALQSKYDITNLVQQIESEIDELQQTGGDIHTIQWWEDMRTNVLESKDIIDDAILISQRAATGFGQAKSETQIKEGEITKLQTDLANAKSDLQAAIAKGKQHAANAAAAQKRFQQNPSPGNKSSLNQNLGNLTNCDTEIKILEARIKVLDGRVVAALKANKKTSANLQTTWKIADEKDLRAKELMQMQLKFKESLNTVNWWPGYQSGTGTPLPEDLEIWVRKEMAIGEKDPSLNNRTDGRKVYNVAKTSIGGLASKVTNFADQTYTDYKSYELKIPIIAKKTRADNSAPLTERDRADMTIDAFLNTFTPKLTSGKVAPDSVRAWFFKYYNPAGEQVDDKTMDVVYLPPKNMFGQAKYEWSDMRNWSIMAKSTEEEKKKIEAASKASTDAADAEARAQKAILDAAAEAESASSALAAAQAGRDAAKLASAQAAAAAAAEKEKQAEALRAQAESDRKEAERLSEEAMKRQLADQKAAEINAKAKADAEAEAKAEAKALAEQQAKARAVTGTSTGSSSTLADPNDIGKYFEEELNKLVNPSRNQLVHTYGKHFYASSDLKKLMTAGGAGLPKNGAWNGFVKSFINDGKVYFDNNGTTKTINMTTGSGVNSLKITYDAFETWRDEQGVKDNGDPWWPEFSANETVYLLLYIIHLQGFEDEDGKVIIPGNQNPLLGNAKASFEGSPFSSMFLWM